MFSPGMPSGFSMYEGGDGGRGGARGRERAREGRNRVMEWWSGVGVVIGWERVVRRGDRAEGSSDENEVRVRARNNGEKGMLWLRLATRERYNVIESPFCRPTNLSIE